MNSQSFHKNSILAGIADRLERLQHHECSGTDRTRAAVAMILREAGGDLEILFIERARDERDPWSGHLAFPGGKVEQGENPRQAAERETWEEIGLDLQSASFLGQFPDIVGANLPVRVSCFVYGINTAPLDMVANAEVHDMFWVSLAEIADTERHLTTMVGFSGTSMEVPAIILPQPDKPVLWGITYRLVMYLLEETSGSASSEPLPDPFKQQGIQHNRN